MDFSQHKTTTQAPSGFGQKGTFICMQTQKKFRGFSLLISIKKRQHFMKLVSTKSTEGAEKQTLKH